MLESIKIRIPYKPDKLDLKILTQKGIVILEPLEPLNILDDIETLKEKARNLTEIIDFPNPYWNIYQLVKPVSMRHNSSPKGIDFTSLGNKTVEINKDLRLDENIL